MAKLKKGSDAAKAWGRKMNALRNSKSRGNINKPVSVKHSTKKVIKISKKDKKSRRGKTGMTFHAIPDLLYAGAGAVVAVPLLDNVYVGWKDYGGLPGVMNGINAYATGDLPLVAKPAAELAVAGIVIQKAAKWLGLNKIGTKEVKIF